MLNLVSVVPTTWERIVPFALRSYYLTASVLFSIWCHGWNVEFDCKVSRHCIFPLM